MARLPRPAAPACTPSRRPGSARQLSIFPLTVVVQRIALELAEQLGTDPDAFGYDVPGRKEAWTALTL